jgi:hypothetical membrane protein
MHRPTTNSPDAQTRGLLICGIIAGPFFVVVSFIQTLSVPGFDLARNAVSQLTLGDLGWIQRTNFIITGLLLIAGAAGMFRAMQTGAGKTWAPILMAVVGVGLGAGGVFVADAGNGFPPGVPAGIPTSMSVHGIFHMIGGSSAFLSLIVLCFVFGRRYASVGERLWAASSGIVGLIFIACLALTGAPAGSRTLFVGGSIALIWSAVISARLMGESHICPKELSEKQNVVSSVHRQYQEENRQDSR